MTGLFPDEYMIKFVLDNVKLEFFQANRIIQLEILAGATFTYFENSKLKIVDLKSIAKLKLVALVMRKKSRDLFDFRAILEHNVFTQHELIELFSKLDDSLTSISNIAKLIQTKKEPQNDESVYLSENDRIDLNFEDIKEQVLSKLKISYTYH